MHKVRGLFYTSNNFLPSSRFAVAPFASDINTSSVGMVFLISAYEGWVSTWIWSSVSQDEASFLTGFWV